MEAKASQDAVNVHFVTHSHMDSGWLKSYDQYYEDAVKQIFDSVFQELKSEPEYTYTVGDIGFFKRYYINQDRAH